MSSIIDLLKKERVKDDATINSLILSSYDTCLRIIKLKNKMGLTNMIYEVPGIHIGFPLYDQELVCLKLNDYLKKKGFKTTYYKPSRIYISW